jgi:hypothetical protein
VEAVAPRFAALLVFVIGFIEGNQILTAWQPSEDVKPGGAYSRRLYQA